MKQLIRYSILSLMTIVCTTLQAVDVEVGRRVPAWIDEFGDTIPNIMLHQVYVYPKLVFKDANQEKFYWRTVRDVKRTLPYAHMIGNLLTELDSTMSTMKTEKERKNFMKLKEDELVATYKPVLKKLTLSQGKMLIRLVDRETDRTSYQLIKEFRGGFRAFFWQGFAKMFGADLKTTYDPNDPDDRIVERVITLVEAGQL